MASARAYPTQGDPDPETEPLDRAAETFRALLTDILGHVRVLQQRNMDPRLFAGLAAIERKAREGSEMASQILDAPQAWSLAPLTANAPSDVPPARILVVGDQDALGRELIETLEGQGHRVEVLNHPLQALTSLRADEVDLLFTDLGTPDLTGWELASRARVLRPGLPVIIVTRHAPQLDQDRLQAMGVARVLSRPYLKEDIVQAVASNVRPLSRAA